MRVGILGGGQLGCMLASALFDVGAEVRFFEPDRDAPACARYHDVVVASWTDEAAMRAFVQGCDVVTYETEHVATVALATSGAKLAPSLHVLTVTQDRKLEKEFLKSAGLPHVPFATASGPSELSAAAAAVGFPCIVKTARGGYDGKGQSFVATPEDLESAARGLAPDAPCVVERALDLALEASVIVARSSRAAAGLREIVFPVVENVHSAHILDLSVVPARIPADLTEALHRLALDAARALDVEGLLTTEFFVTRASEAGPRGLRVGAYEVFVNELAPRPHNSGHVTRNACTLSQFDALARVLAGVPLAAPELLGDDTYCMGNLLGDVWLAQGRPQGALDLGLLAAHPDVVDVVLYGKREAQARRKMGHFVTRAAEATRAVASAKAFRDGLLARDAP